MILWIDAQPSPYLSSWVSETFGAETRAVRDLGLLGATDEQIFREAADAGATIITKDSDFLSLLRINGPPPQVLWITCGNTSNAYLKGVLEKSLATAIELLEQGEPLVEIRDSR